jgi:hypothetical protein
MIALLHYHHASGCPLHWLVRIDDRPDRRDTVINNKLHHLNGTGRNKMNCWRRIVLMLVLLVAGTVQAGEAAIGWSELNHREQEALQPFQDDWDKFSPERQQKLRLNVERMANMTPEQREQMGQRFQQWKNMSPEEREHARRRFEHFKQLSPEERQQLVGRYKSFQDLSPEERSKIQQRWQNLTPAEREQYKEQARQDLQHPGEGPAVMPPWPEQRK